MSCVAKCPIFRHNIFNQMAHIGDNFMKLVSGRWRKVFDFVGFKSSFGVRTSPDSVTLLNLESADGCNKNDNVSSDSKQNCQIYVH